MSELVRVVFELEENAWHNCSIERLWCEPLGGDRYRVANTPFLAFGVSFEDEIVGEVRDGEIHFGGTVLESGRSTYRIFFLKPYTRQSPEFLATWERLAAIGCTYEEGRVLAIDVPPAADVAFVFRLLESGAQQKYWDLEEGHCSSRHRARVSPS